MPSESVKHFLEDNHVPYTTMQHSRAYTAHEIAAAAHISGRDLAKTVVVVIDNALAMVVIPASRKVDLLQLKEFTGGSSLTIANEYQFQSAFPDCELGAMPPIGTLYGIPVYADESLRGKPLTFNAGTHHELISIDWSDFERMVQPACGRFAVRTLSKEAHN